MLYKMESFFQNFDFHIMLTMGFVASQYGRTYFPKKMPHTLDNLIVAGQHQILGETTTHVHLLTTPPN